jgi:hypothetical protein
MMAMRFWRSCWRGCMGEELAVGSRQLGERRGGLGGDGEDDLQVRFSGFAAGYFGGADREASAGE